MQVVNVALVYRGIVCRVAWVETARNLIAFTGYRYIDTQIALRRCRGVVYVGIICACCQQQQGSNRKEYVCKSFHLFMLLLGFYVFSLLSR